MNCKYIISFNDFKLEADSISALVDKVIANYKRIIGIFGMLSYWNGISYEQMKLDDIRLFRKLYTILLKKRHMENDFI